MLVPSEYCEQRLGYPFIAAPVLLLALCALAPDTTP